MRLEHEQTDKAKELMRAIVKHGFNMECSEMYCYHHFSSYVTHASYISLGDRSIYVALEKRKIHVEYFDSKKTRLFYIKYSIFADHEFKELYNKIVWFVKESYSRKKRMQIDSINNALEEVIGSLNYSD